MAFLIRFTDRIFIHRTERLALLEEYLAPREIWPIKQLGDLVDERFRLRCSRALSGVVPQFCALHLLICGLPNWCRKLFVHATDAPDTGFVDSLPFVLSAIDQRLGLSLGNRSIGLLIALTLGLEKLIGRLGVQRDDIFMIGATSDD